MTQNKRKAASTISRLAQRARRGTPVAGGADAGLDRARHYDDQKRKLGEYGSHAQPKAKPTAASSTLTDEDRRRELRRSAEVYSRIIAEVGDARPDIRRRLRSKIRDIEAALEGGEAPTADAERKAAARIAGLSISEYERARRGVADQDDTHAEIRGGK